jgi:acetyl esterase/lipase
MLIFKRFLIFALIFGIISLFACSVENESESEETSEATSELPLPPRPEKLWDLGEVYDFENGLVFDIYYPTQIKYAKRPLVVAFHGGGWVAGDRSQIMYLFAPIIAELRENGYAVATVQYRYAQQATFPAQIRDCANAIQYISDNADKYGIDPNSIGLMGYSAGAQLAMLASYAPFGSDLYDRKYSFDIMYCLSFAGPTKMYGEERDDYSGGIRYLLEWLFGGEYAEMEAEYMAGSPYYYIDATTKKTPLFLSHDEKDDTVPFSQSRIMYDRAIEAGIPCEFLALSGVYHQIDFLAPYMHSPSAEDAAKTVLDFVYKFTVAK